MKCKACERPNPDDHHYCGYCGRPLRPGDAPAGPGLQGEPLQAAVEAFKSKLDKIESETAHRIKTDAISWAKGLMTLYGGVLVILLAALSFFGIKQSSDLKNAFHQVQGTLDRIELDVKEKTDALLKNLVSENDKATAALNQLKANLDTLYSSVEEEQKHLNELTAEAKKLNYAEKIGEIEQLKAYLAEKVETVQAIDKKLTKSENGLYAINLQFGSGISQSDLTQYVKLLAEKGFVIGEANIIHISVNRSEVIFYNRQANSGAELIAETFKPSFPTIARRFVDRKEKYSREILIKLARQ